MFSRSFITSLSSQSTGSSSTQISIPTDIHVPIPSMSSTLEAHNIQILPFSSAKKRKFDDPNSLSTDQNGSASSRLRISTSSSMAKNDKRPYFETPNCRVSVNMIPPTLRGITEAARILRGRNPMGGILAIPTEKFYTSLCFAPFQRNVRNSPTSPCPTDPYLAWNIRKFCEFGSIFLLISIFF